jgi:DNA-binding transcriptional LysR family regulator
VIGCEESNSSVLLERVSEAKVDAAFVRLPLDCRGLATQALVEEDVLAVLPPRHRLARRRSLDLGDLAGDPLILFPRAIGPDLYDSIISACHAAGFNPVISMESPQISSTVNMAAAGFGVTLIPSSMRQIQAKGVTYHDLKGGTLHTTIALVHRPREKAPTVQNFVRIVRDASRHAPQG